MSQGCLYRCTRICPSGKNISARHLQHHPATEIQPDLVPRRVAPERSKIDEISRLLTRPRPAHRCDIGTLRCVRPQLRAPAVERVHIQVPRRQKARAETPLRGCRANTSRQPFSLRRPLIFGIVRSSHAITEAAFSEPTREREEHLRISAFESSALHQGLHPEMKSATHQSPPPSMRGRRDAQMAGDSASARTVLPEMALALPGQRWGDRDRDRHDPIGTRPSGTPMRNHRFRARGRAASAAVR